MAVKVQFEIGHTSKLRSKKTPEGFTHDWELYVQGVNKSDINAFVEKVVFNLHESFPKPKRVCKEPPYVIQESGYAGFVLAIDIYFRNRDEPKRVQFSYDLDLQTTGPPQHRFEVKKFIFESPSEELRPKLLKGGGVPVSGVISGNVAVPSVPLGATDEGMVSKPKLSNSESTGKKHKSRTDDAKMSTFANLFGGSHGKSGSNKHSPDSKSSTSSGSRSMGGNATPTSTSSSTSNTTNNSRDRFNKEKSNSTASATASIEKMKEKVEKREKHKQSSPHKEARAENKKGMLNESNKHDKRSEDKPKKDKSRDKERGRSKEKNAGISNTSGTKRSLSPKNMRELGAPSPKRLPSPSPLSQMTRAMPAASGRLDENNKVAKNKVEDESKAKENKSKDPSSSSGKKSKKEKKDKDKDKERDKEKRDDHKDKHRNNEAKGKDDRFNNASQNLNSNQNMAMGAAVGDNKDGKLQSQPNSNNKKIDRESKAEASKGKNGSKTEKEANQASNGSDKKFAPNNNVGIEKEKKSHKHKKKEKNKDKDKDRERDKEKDKERDKERIKEKEKTEEKTNEKFEAQPNPTGNNNMNVEFNGAASEALPAVSAPLSNVGPLAPASATISTSSTKKAQNKEKKIKEKLNKDEKRQGFAAEMEITKNYVKSPMNTAPAITNSNVLASTKSLDLSDPDSENSVGDFRQPATELNTVSGAGPEPHSDSSSSSFPDLPPVKSNNRLSESPIVPTSSTPSPTKETKAKISKELKPRANEKNFKVALEKPDKLDKEEKKRRRNSTLATNYTEPPLKQIKKEGAKMARETSNSPSMRGSVVRGNVGGENSNALPLVAAPIGGTNCNTVSTTVTLSPGSSAPNQTSHAMPLTTPVQTPTSPAHAADAVSNTLGASSTAATINTNTSVNSLPVYQPLSIEYLSELQELHHKIMTMQDNDELQQVVEMIAATGCYEITAKTFDFDLCKLDRHTVQRLQEFFSTSVS